jgi:pantothenate kinase
VYLLVLNISALHEKLRSVNLLRDQTKDTIRGKPVIAREEVTNLILKRWEMKNRRRIVAGVVGFPASGKTTLAKALAHGINELCNEDIAIHLPMDGFHFSNERLQKEGLESIKGDLSTYDVASYVKTVLSFTRNTGSSLFAPDYLREKHDVVENAIEVKQGIHILITEGIYVGYSGPGWDKLKPLLDILFYLDSAPEQCADLIVARNFSAGRSRERIVQQLEKDLRFMKTCVHILPRADYIIKNEEVIPFQEMV